MDKKQSAKSPEDIRKQLVLTGADIVQLGASGEMLVGGKNYNTAIISQIKEIQAPHFRAISSVAFHHVLDESKVNSRLVRSMVDQEYGRIDRNDPENTRPVLTPVDDIPSAFMGDALNADNLDYVLSLYAEYYEKQQITAAEGE